LSLHAAIAIGLAVYAVLIVIAWACCAIAGREMYLAEKSEDR
jgi:hypothetical protein